MFPGVKYTVNAFGIVNKEYREHSELHFLLKCLKNGNVKHATKDIKRISPSVIANYRDSENKNNTALHAVVSTDGLGIVDLLEMLVFHVPGMQVNAKNSDGDTALHLCARRNHSGIMKLLFPAEGIDVNAQNKNMETPLTIAAEKNYPWVVKVLLGHPEINLNIPDGQGETALLKASRWGSTELVRILVGHDQLRLPSEARNQAIRTAYFLGYAEIVDILRDTHGSDNGTRNMPGESTTASRSLEYKDPLPYDPGDEPNQPPFVSGGTYTIRSMSHRKVVGLYDDVMESPLRLGLSSGADEQYWVLKKRPDDSFTIHNVKWTDYEYAGLGTSPSGQKIVASSKRRIYWRWQEDRAGIRFFTLPKHAFTLDTTYIPSLCSIVVAGLAWQAMPGGEIHLQKIDPTNVDQLFELVAD